MQRKMNLVKTNLDNRGVDSEGEKKSTISSNVDSERIFYDFFAAFRSFSNFSAPTHSLAKAHHSIQDVPMGRAFR